MNYRKLTENLNKGKILSIETCAVDVRQKEALNNISITDDSRIRFEIQSFIIDRVSKGDSKEQILAVLQSDYRIAKFSQYFEGWVDNHMRIDKRRTGMKIESDRIAKNKMNYAIKKQQKSREEEER